VVAGSRDAVLDLADKHHDAMAFDRATTLAWTQAQMQLRHLGITPDEAHLFQRLASHILYSDPALRPSARIKRGAAQGSTLWAHGISGDRPIVLVRIDGEDDLDLVRQLLRAHEYWRLKQLAVDLVILNDRAASYPGFAGLARDAGADEPVRIRNSARPGAGRCLSCAPIWSPRNPRPAACRRPRRALWQSRHARRTAQPRPRPNAGRTFPPGARRRPRSPEIPLPRPARSSSTAGRLRR
jgi:hypothetical protein